MKLALLEVIEMPRPKAAWAGGEPAVHYSFLVSAETDRRLREAMKASKWHTMSDFLRETLAQVAQAQTPEGESEGKDELRLEVALRGLPAEGLQLLAGLTGVGLEALVQGLVARCLPAAVQEAQESSKGLQASVEGMKAKKGKPGK